MSGGISNLLRFSNRSSEVPFAVLASDINRYVLDNGMVILSKEVYPSRVLFLSLWARVGSSYETDEEAGYSHFVEHMLFKTTQKRKIGQIAQEVHTLGGYLNGFTSFDCTAYWIVLPGKSFSKAIEILHDAVFNPLFEPKEVDKERNVIIEEIKMYHDNPADYLSQKVMRKAFQKHRYGRPIIGYEKILKKATTPDLKAYYDSYYKPNNCFLIAVGDVKTMDIIKKSERIYKKLKEGKVQRSPSPQEPPQKKMRRVELEGDILTGYLQFAFHIPSIFDRDIYPLSLISSVLGEGLSSRLYRQLREEMKLVNEVSVYTFNQRDPCLLFIEIELPPKNIEKTEKVVFDILQDVRENGIEDREFERARNLYEANYIFGQEEVESQGRKIGYAEIMGDYMLIEKFIQRVLTVEKEEARQAAARYLVPENCTVGIYRPR